MNDEVLKYRTAEGRPRESSGSLNDSPLIEKINEINSNYGRIQKG